MDRRGVMTSELMSRARAGDAVAFRELTEPHRRELRVHCYRMLGSFQDAEDVLQEALLAAWQGLRGFEGRASLRAWLYKIATNRCLNARRSASRRITRAYDVPAVTPPEPTRLGEVTWLEPFPDTLFEAVGGAAFGPHVRYEQSESISLSFVTALQVLPRRQLAVLILCDIVGFESSEVADMLGSTRDSVNSALKRARAKLQDRPPRSDDRPSAAAHSSTHEGELIAKFARAWESADVDAVVALLTNDVFISMPPFPNEYEGRELAARFFASIFEAGRRFELVLTKANGQPAFGAYLRTDSGVSQGAGLYVLALGADGISALTRFEQHVLGWFGLPPSLPS
jgi:RNA polymerase sigma-70 factor (TIGR02960 family)